MGRLGSPCCHSGGLFTKFVRVLNSVKKEKPGTIVHLVFVDYSKESLLIQPPTGCRTTRFRIKATRKLYT